MIGETGMSPPPSSTVIMVIIAMEMSGLMPIIHHFNSNAYVGKVEMIGEITVINLYSLQTD